MLLMTAASSLPGDEAVVEKPEGDEPADRRHRVDVRPDGQQPRVAVGRSLRAASGALALAYDIICRRVLRLGLEVLIGEERGELA